MELLVSFTYVNAQGFGKALDDGQEGVGGQHRRLVRVRVDDFGRHYIWNKFAMRNGEIRENI